MRDGQEWIGALLGDLRDFAKDAKMHQLVGAIDTALVVAQIEMQGKLVSMHSEKPKVSEQEA